jgi:ankyrin repeat protein
MNDRFLEAVKALDALLIHNWIMDPDRRPHLKPEYIQSALFDLAGLKEPTEERFQVEAESFRDQAVCVILDECNPDLECLDAELKATPLILAALCGREDITKLLIDAGANLQAKDGIFKRTALSWAARNDFIETAELLLTALDEWKDGKTIQSKDINGHTALDLANQNGHKYMARLIRSRSTRPNASYTSGVQSSSSS